MCFRLPRVNVALDGESVARGEVGVDSKPSMRQMHAIVSILSGKVGKMILIQVISKNPVGSAAFGFTAILRRSKSLCRRAATAGRQGAQGILRPHGDLILMTPFTALFPQTVLSWSANHLDSVYIFERHIDRVPGDSAP